MALKRQASFGNNKGKGKGKNKAPRAASYDPYGAEQQRPATFDNLAKEVQDLKQALLKKGA